MVSLIKKVAVLFFVLSLPVLAQADVMPPQSSDSQSNRIQVSYGHFGVGFSFNPREWKKIFSKEDNFFILSHKQQQGLLVTIKEAQKSQMSFDEYFDEQVRINKEKGGQIKVFGIRKNFQLNQSIKNASEVSFTAEKTAIAAISPLTCRMIYFESHQKFIMAGFCSAKNTQKNHQRAIAELIQTLTIPAAGNQHTKIVYPEMNVVFNSIDKDWLFICDDQEACFFLHAKEGIKVGFSWPGNEMNHFAQWLLIWLDAEKKKKIDNLKLKKFTIDGREVQSAEYDLIAAGKDAFKMRVYAYQLPLKKIVMLDFLDKKANFAKNITKVEALVKKIQFIK